MLSSTRSGVFSSNRTTHFTVIIGALRSPNCAMIQVTNGKRLAILKENLFQTSKV
jgi:hypothetical protein